jgi:hypothetical protein
MQREYSTVVSAATCTKVIQTLGPPQEVSATMEVMQRDGARLSKGCVTQPGGHCEWLGHDGVYLVYSVTAEEKGGDDYCSRLRPISHTRIVGTLVKEVARWSTLEFDTVIERSRAPTGSCVTSLWCECRSSQHIEAAKGHLSSLLRAGQ